MVITTGGDEEERGGASEAEERATVVLLWWLPAAAGVGRSPHPKPKLLESRTKLYKHYGHSAMTNTRN